MSFLGEYGVKQRRMCGKGLVLALFVTLLITAGAGVAAHPPAGHWTFDEGQGQVAHDSAGNNDGTLGKHSGSDSYDPDWATGIIGGALDFEGYKGDYVQVPHDASLNRDTLTMTAWVYLRGQDHSDDIIIAKEGAYKMALDENTGELIAGINGGCSGGGWCDNGGNGWLYSGFEVPENQWTHVAAAWDGTHITFFVNGDQVERFQPSEVNSYTPIRDTTRDVGIGARNVDKKPHSYFYGKIDDVRLYEDPLTEDDFTEGGCQNDCDPRTVNIHINNNYNYTFNYDYSTYNYTYNDYAYTTNNYYNYTYVYVNNTYIEETTINETTVNVENTYNTENTYIYYYFGGDCPSTGCEYVCDTPSCADQNTGSGDSDPNVVSSGVDLEIVEASYPSQISAGQEIDFRVTVQNRGDMNANDVTIAIQAYGQLKEVTDLSVASGQQQTFTIPFTVPNTASGPEDVQIEALALNSQGGVMERDIATVPVDVTDRYMTLRLSPSRVTVGESVDVHGVMSHHNMDADLYIGGFYITTLTSSETRQYSHTILAEEPGFFRVELRSGNVQETAFLRVDPRIGITDMSVPETANTQDSFEVCATVTKSTPGQVTLRLFVDGEERQTETFVVQGEQRRCFNTALTAAGDHDVTFEVEADGNTDTQTQTMQVIESRIEVNVFPQQLTLEAGNAGVFQISIQNRDAQPRTFNINVAGLQDIAETTSEQVALGSSESRTVFVRVVPPESGIYRGNVTVTSDGFTFADTQVAIFAQENPALKGPLSRAGRAVQDAVQYVTDRATLIGIGLGAIIVLGAIALILYRRARRRDVIEPRY